MAPPARAHATIDVQAIARNVARMRQELRAPTRLCAVVKADAYGHGVQHAIAGALDGGADWLAVVTAAEAAQAREIAGSHLRILTMGALLADEVAVALEACSDIVVWDEQLLAGLPDSARVHIKLDTGMGRLGTRDPQLATQLAEQAAERGMLAGLMTHFATADERDDAFFGEQLARFSDWAMPLRARLPGVLVHAANSAATLRDPAAHFDMVRAGVAIYGLDPFMEDAAQRRLIPALELTSWVAAVKRCAVGQSAGYGRRFVAQQDTVTATIPIGYGDGWRRGLTNNGEVAIGGARYPLVGTVSMDNIIVDLGADGGGVAVGDIAWLIGGGISAEDVARRLDTINYEITCGLTPRVGRTAR